MAKGINIDVAMNTREVQRGAKDLEKSFDDVADSLDDMARDADKAGDKLGDSLKDGAKESGREVEKLERKFKDMADAVKRESKSGGDALARNTKDGTSRAARDLEELGNEARANAAETFSSFDGSAESFADGIQGTLGGIVSSLGPIGAAAGAAGALGIGLIMSAMEGAEVESEEFRAKVQELAQEFIETGGQGEASLEYIVEKLKELASETDKGKDSLADLAKAADTNGRSFEDLATYFAGNVDGLDKIIAKEQDVLRAMEKTDSFRANPLDQSYYDANVEAQTKIIQALQSTRDVTAEAAAAEEAYARAGGPELEAKAERAEEYASSIVDALDDAGSSWEDYQDKETGALNLEAYNANIEARVAAMENYKSNLATLSSQINEEALSYIQSLGADAAPLLQAYADAPNDQKERTAANWASLGRAASDSYTRDLKAGIPTSIPGPKVVISVDDSAVEAWRQRPRVFNGTMIVSPRMGAAVS